MLFNKSILDLLKKIKNQKNMFKKIMLFALAIQLTSCSTAQLGGILDQVSKIPAATNGEPSSQEVGSGLKEALNLGIGKGVDFLSAKDGYYKSAYKILLPADAQKVVTKLRNIPGFDKVEEIAIEKMNHAAEDAAVKAKPIFIKAIREMSFADAWNILTGGKGAATSYLKEKTYQTLYSEFNPVVVESLNKFGAVDYWAQAANTYNKLPFVSGKANPRIDDYVTSKALDGLFSMVTEKENDIRQNPVARTTDLLKKVFSRAK